MELVYNVLDSLWTAALYRIHSLSVTTLAEKESEDVEESDSEEEIGADEISAKLAEDAVRHSRIFVPTI